MATRTAERAAAPSASAAAQPPERRVKDANKTRQMLVDAAFRRFACDGYAGTTVRDIAVEAGVNVALINRYFQSKEGLFEACLQGAVDELKRISGSVSDVSQIAEAISRQGADSGGRSTQVMRLLLRSSGEPHAEQLRIGLLRTFSEHLATTAGWGPEESEELLLRAQLVLALSIGVTVLRASPGVEPLASAGESDLAGPVRDVVHTLLGR